MSAINKGLLDWSLNREDDGSRTYEVTWLVKTSGPEVGPNEVSFAAGLPAIGTPWSINGDSDPWAFCMPYAQVKRHKSKEGEKSVWWTVTQKFASPSKRGNKEGEKYCKDQQFEDPLSEPPKISGSFNSFEEETRKAYKVTYESGSAWPNHDDPDTPCSIIADVPAVVPLFGITRTRSTHDISISFNKPTLDLDLVGYLLNCLNDATLWGMPPGHVRFNSFSWEELYYGVCSKYYRQTLEFSIKRNGWAIEVDSLSPVGFDPDLAATPDNDPKRKDLRNYKYRLDKEGNMVKEATIIKPNGSFYTEAEITAMQSTGSLPKARVITIETDPRANLLQLGIPSTLT